MKRNAWWRWLVDSVAGYVAWSIQFAASGDIAASIITVLAVWGYGLWCFHDGRRA
jgi:nicotinamide riboside transporter PnuC